MTDRKVYIEKDIEINKAVSLANSGQIDRSLSKLLGILERTPKNEFVILNIANIFLLKGLFDRAEEFTDRFLENQTMSFFDFYLQAHSIFTQIACFKKAIKVAEILTKEFPNELQSWWLLAEAAFDGRSFEDGVYAGNEFLKRAPQHVDMKVYLANLYSSKGEFEKAEKLYREALAVDPSHTIAIHGLSKCKKFVKGFSELIKLCEKTTSDLNNENHPDAEGFARVKFAQAKIYNDIKDYDSAWLCASEANSRLSKIIPYDQQQFSRYTEEIIRKFSHVTFEKAYSNDLDRVPILIVGMPRSGTTLVEQILSLDSNIYAGGEKQGFDYSVFKTFGQGDYLTQVLGANKQQIKMMADSYISYYHQFSNFKGTRIVDKVPRNYLHLGIFKMLFPNIKIINMLRDKLDNATSIFFEHFANRINYTNSIDDILYARKEYENLMNFWNKVMPENILNVHYEELTENYESKKNEIIEFCHLNIDNNGNFERSDNQVETPSVWQVRQGINTKSVNRWKRYKKQLQAYI